LQQKNTYVPVLLLVVVLLTIIEVIFLLPITRVPNVSAVETPYPIGVYWDAKCENRVDSVDWGKLSPGSIRNFDVYVRNECNESMILGLLTENWSPLTAAQEISVSWDYHGHAICENQVIATELALSVSPEMKGVTSFSFDIIIECKEYALSLGEVAEKKILYAPVNTVYFIYADPAYMARAEATYDVTSGEAIRNLCANNQHYGFNTTNYWLTPLCTINTTTIHNATIAMFGGRCPNMVMRYYETVKELAPVKFKDNSTHIWFENRAGTILGSVPQSVMEIHNYHEDMFTAMAFYDEDGDNIFLSCMVSTGREHGHVEYTSKK